MKPLKSTLVLLGLLTLSQIAYAEDKKPNYTDGNEFVSNCEDTSKDPEKLAWCKGFMVGFDQGHTTMSYITRKGKEFDISRDGLVYCPPNNVTHIQAVKMIVAYIKTHPKEAYLPAGLLAAYTLHDNFPCSKDTTPANTTPSSKNETQFKRD